MFQTITVYTKFMCVYMCGKLLNIRTKRIYHQVIVNICALALHIISCSLGKLDLAVR